MDERQKQLVQSSFENVVPIADTAAALFYGRLFELDPSLRTMFPADLREQGRKLMKMLTLAVRGLNRPDQLIPAVQALGCRHADYGVRPEHYAVVGSALLWTLQEGLGETFTAEVRDAWVAVFTLLSTTMQEAAAEANAMGPSTEDHPVSLLSARA